LPTIPGPSQPTVRAWRTTSTDTMPAVMPVAARVAFFQLSMPALARSEPCQYNRNGTDINHLSSLRVPTMQHSANKKGLEETSANAEKRCEKESGEPSHRFVQTAKKVRESPATISKANRLSPVRSEMTWKTTA